jgi:hypothetical protein
VFITLMDTRVISPQPENVSYVHKSDVTQELAKGVRAVRARRGLLIEGVSGIVGAALGRKESKAWLSVNG